MNTNTQTNEILRGLDICINFAKAKLYSQIDPREEIHEFGYGVLQEAYDQGVCDFKNHMEMPRMFLLEKALVTKWKDGYESYTYG